MPPASPAARKATATAIEREVEKTSKFKNLLAQLGEGLPNAFLNRPNTDVPGLADALAQTGGNVGEAVKLLQRGTGLGAGLVVGAIPIGAAAPAGLTAGALHGAATGLASTLASVGTEGLVGGHSLKETVDMAKDQSPWGIGFGALGGGIAGKLAKGQKVLDVAHILPTTISSPAHIAVSMQAGGELKAATGETLNLFKALKDESKEVAKDAGRAVGRAQRISLKEWKELPDIVRDALIKEHVPDPLALSPEDKAIYKALQAAGGLPQKLKPARAPQLPEAVDLARAVRQTIDEELGPGLARLSDGTPVYRRAAMQAARKAGWERSRAMLNADLLHAKQLIAGLDAARETGNSISRLFADIDKKVVRSVKGYIEKTPSLFPAAIAKPLTKALDDFSLLYERTRGQWLEHNRQFVLKGLSKAEGEEFSRVAAGETVTSNPKVQAAVANWTHLWNTLGDFADEVGLKLIDRRLTAQIRRMTNLSKDGFTKARLDKLNMAAETNTFTGLTKAERKLVLLLQGSKAKLTGSGKDVFGEVAFRRAKKPAPFMYSRSFLEAVRKRGTPEEAETLRHMIANKFARNEEEARNILKELFVTSDSAPFDTRGGGLQWSKENLLPPDRRIMDPKIWTEQYIDNAARRLSGAHTFGPKDELVEQTLDVLRQAKGPAQAQEEVLRIFRDLNGRGDNNNEAIKLTRSLAATTFLSAKTLLLQLGQMANPAGMFGAKNTLAASFLALSPKNRQAMVEVGVTLADAERHLMDESVHGFVDALPHIKGIKAVDAHTRIVGGIAAGLRTQEAASQIVAARMGSGKYREAARLLEYVGLNPQEVAQQGGRLTSEQLRNAIQTGAHKTMFGNRSQDLPYVRTHAAGKFFMTLLTYAYRQSKFVVSDLLPEARRGNMKPLLSFAAAIGLGSAPPAMWQAMTQKKDFQDVWLSTIMSSALGLLGKPIEVASNPQASLADVPATSVIVRGGDALLHGDPARALPNVLRGPWMPAR